METTYDYSIASDFPQARVDTSRLSLEIAASAIVTALARIETAADVCSVVFKDALSVGDEAVLDALVAAHQGEPLPTPARLVTLDGPKESDLKPIVTISPATQGFLTWICGAGDDPAPIPPATGRGEGAPFILTFVAGEIPATKELLIQFNEPLEFHDGEVVWRDPDNWGVNDIFSLGLKIPATVAVANGAGTGNCDKVAVGPGMHAIVPAAGTGAFDADLSAACPVEDRTGIGGYWTVDYNTGVVTPGPIGTGRFNLFDFEVSAWLIKNIRMTHPLGIFEIDVYKTEWFHPSWRLLWRVTKTTPGDGQVSGWIFSFRRQVA